MAKQIIRTIKNKNRKAKGIIVDKRSIGTIWINGVPHTYNADKLATNRLDFEDRQRGVNPRKSKKKIVIRRKTKR